VSRAARLLRELAKAHRAGLALHFPQKRSASTPAPKSHAAN